MTLFLWVLVLLEMSVLFFAVNKYAMKVVSRMENVNKSEEFSLQCIELLFTF